MSPLPAHHEPVIDLAACARGLRAARLLPADAVAAFCVGSAARGWATPMSDYDIYIVSVTPFSTAESVGIAVPLKPDVIPVHMTYVDGRRWEIKYWTTGQIAQMLAKVSRERFEAGDMVLSLTVVEEACLERVLTCLPIIGDDWVAACRDSIRKSAYREFIVSKSLADADKACENAIGQIAADHLHGAVLSAQAAVRHTVDALLDSHECYGSLTPKWRARRMQEAAPATLPFDQYWAMETMADLDRGNPEPWIRQTISWCKQMMMEIEV